MSSTSFLSKFFISVRKQDGNEYEARTLSGFQRSFQRHLHDKGSLINIPKDNEFSQSREVLAVLVAKRKNILKSLKATTGTFNINVFCGDQSKIARLNKN